MKSSETVLKVENLWKWFDEKPVLKGISFEVRRGEVKVIMGPSGAGKSTLLKCIDMLVEPDEGKIWLEGVE
ncbi:MAG: glutamine ABC transporter ATP-binding protein, partial [Thaumarchaeota archaeon]